MMRSLRRGIEFDGQAPIVKGAPVGVAAADPAVGVDMTRAGADLELPREALWPASWHADRETIRMASADSRSAQRRAGVSIVDITPLYALPARLSSRLGCWLAAWLPPSSGGLPPACG